jgi:hypothetical protein
MLSGLHHRIRRSLGWSPEVGLAAPNRASHKKPSSPKQGLCRKFLSSRRLLFGGGDGLGETEDGDGLQG